MTESGQDAAGRPRSTDAQRNHERVAAAAAEALREHGSGASVRQIAARAGVGKAAVYRSFPAKDDLLEATTRLSLDELRQRTAGALRETETDPVTWRRCGEMVLRERGKFTGCGWESA
jgi:AcrR family transcriptional regulator